MANASFNIAQLLGAATSAGAKGKGTASIGDALLGGGDAEAFKSLLLGGLAKSRASQVAASDFLSGAKPANADQSGLIELISVSPDLLARLQSLKTEDLASLPGPLAAVFAPHMTPDGTLDETAQSMLDTLASLTTQTQSIEGLFMQDPEIAKLLGQLSAALKGTATTDIKDGAFAGLFDELASKTLGTTANVTAAHVSENGDGLVLVTDKGNVTINVADMDLDQFNAFKKLAFADLAPFLTETRAVRVDAHTIMNIAQGPDFLLDPNAPRVTFIRVSENVGALPAGVLAHLSSQAVSHVQSALDAQAQNQAGVSAAPIFLDAAVIARAAGKVTQTPVTSTAQTTDAQTMAFNRAGLYAALLGVPSSEAQKTATTTAAAKAQTADAALQFAQGPVLPQSSVAQGTPLVQSFAAQLQPGKTAINAGTALKGLDTSLISADADAGDMSSSLSLDTAFPVRAESAGTSAAASTLLMAKTASVPHPAIHLVSVSLARAAEGGIPGGDRQFTIQLDPENLGRVKVTLEFGENNTVKAKLIAERPETVALLQKDAAALEKSLHNTGFDVKADGLTFSLGDNNSFSGNMSQNGNSYQNGGNKPSDEDGTDLATIHTVMSVFVDPVTGLTHVNIVV
jgi:flagellar hook-length control protein FliK